MANAPLIRARWFNGQSSRPQEVRIALQPGAKGPSLHLFARERGDSPLRSFAHADVEWPPVWSRHRSPAVITVSLFDAGSLEIDSPKDWQEALTQAGERPSLTQRMQTHWPVFLGVLLVAVIGIVSFYRYGTPWAATQISRHVPLDWELNLTERALEQLDQAYLKPSKLLPERQAQLRTRFDALLGQLGPDLKRYPDYAPKFTLAFRAGMGANAFALPGGTVVMTDGLAEAAAQQGLGDDALTGVLAHEIGHVVHRHTTRMVVEQGVLNIGLGLALGDVSSLVSLGSSLLTGLAYRRQHETEADCFAVALMKRAHFPTEPMADLLLGISSARDDQRKDKPADKTTQGSITTWLSSHPETRQRAEQLKAGQALGCPA